MSTNPVAVVDPVEKIAKSKLSAGGSVAAIVPQDAEQAYRMAQMIANSGIAPPDMRSPEKIVAAIFQGLEVGLKPLQAVQSIAIVNGRPCIWGDAALGLVMGSGMLETIEERIEGTGDGMRAICRVKRSNNSVDTERSFSVEDAKCANLWGKQGPWKQYPKRMLQMRARSWALRDAFADVLKGLGIREEIRDYIQPVPRGESGHLTGQAIINQAHDFREVDEPEPEPEPDPDFREVDEPEPDSEPDSEPAAEPEADDFPGDAASLIVPLTATPAGKNDWVTYTGALRRKIKATAPTDIQALREANEPTLAKMREQSKGNHDSLVRAMSDREAG